MLKPQILASEAIAPYNTYDSKLELPNGSDPDQHAWLTLQLRVKLNFVDSRNQVAGLTHFRDGKWYGQDADGYLFPLVDWPPHLIVRFQREYAERAENTWNWQFMLITPRDYPDLDFQCLSSGVTVRPNVLCLFRMSVMTGMGAALDTSPAAGPMALGAPHQTINVMNISYAAGTVKKATGSATKTFPQIDGLSFRSDSLYYDDADLFRPAWWSKEHGVLSNTVGHEVGHSLGQCHIMGLKGNPQYTFTGANANDKEAYGVGSANKLDAWNIMGGGDRVYLVNAVSWQQRIALHTGRPAADWTPTGIMTTPTRAQPMGLGGAIAPREW
jgi:hypothetical protein